MVAARILVVDDEPGVRYFVEETLSDHEYQVISTGSGKAALELIQEEEFDVALLDLKMGTVEGLEVLAALHYHAPGTAAIILTGHGSLETAIAALRQGAADYLLKPCDPEQLRASIRAGLAGRRQARQQQESARLVADVTHQLRGPITAIGLNLELLERDTQEHQGRYLESLKQAATQMQSLVEGTLTLTRLGLTDRTSRLTAVNFNLVVLQVVAVYQAQAEKIGLDLTLDLATDLPRVWAVQELLSQAVANLVANALHYTPNGQVTLRTYVEPQQVCLAVQDTGVGIPEDELPRLFQRFCRGRAAHYLDTQGSGLGLAIVKEIVDLHRGSVSVTSQVGVGSTFYIKLPVWQEAANGE